MQMVARNQYRPVRFNSPRRYLKRVNHKFNHTHREETWLH